MSDLVALADWRRRVHELYAAVRDLARSDPVAAHAAWRAGRDELFRDHPQTPLLEPSARAAFAGLRYFPYDPAFRFSTVLEPLVGRPAEVPTSDGAAMRFELIGHVTLPIGRLAVEWLPAYAGGIFLAFRDGTSGRATYGGGRYLLDTAKGADLGLD